MKILIADDHKLLAQAVGDALERAAQFQVILTSCKSGATRELAQAAFDVILLDLRMPGMAGLSSVEAILKSAGDGHVVLFTGQLDQQFLDDAIELGVKGYISKSMPLKSLEVALRLIKTGQTFIPHGWQQTDHMAGGYKSSEPLTERELLALRLAADGFINKEIARDLAVSEAQVKLIMRQACQKLSARNRAHACMLARERLLI